MTRGDEKKAERDGVAGMSWRDSVIVGGLALSLPGMLFGPVVVGYMLDQWFGTTWLVWVFGVIGVLGTGIDVFIILKRTRLVS